MDSLFTIQILSRRFTAVAFAMAGVMMLAVATPYAAAQTVDVNCAKTHQEITGFGTCGMHWTGGDLYANPKLQKMFVEDLGATIVRFALPPEVLPKEVDSAKDISYKNFEFKNKAARAPLDYVASVYAMDPKEMKVIASVWSPPAWMKTNHKIGGGQLLNKMIPFYAEYLAQWALYMQDVEHTPIYAISIQNELRFNEPYGSCTYTPDVYHATADAVADAFKAHHLSTKLFGPEGMTWDVNGDVGFIKPLLEDPQTKSIFIAAATHGYVDGIKPAGSAQQSAALWKALEPLDIPWWMTETSGTQPGFFGTGLNKKGNPKAGAFDLAEQIHNALTYGNASAWVYWCLSGHSKADTDAAAGEALMNGLTPTKKYYVSKQYYRYIRPGAVRVDAGPDGENDLQISAYLHAKNHTLTVVMLNHAKSDAKITMDVKDGPPLSTFEAYCTSESQDCEKLPDVRVNNGKATVTLLAQSVVTLFGTAR